MQGAAGGTFGRVRSTGGVREEDAAAGGYRGRDGARAG